jgi:hypothetical protein
MTSTSVRVRALSVVAGLLVCVVGASSVASASHGELRSDRSRRGATSRPDALIKLCGLSTGCVIDPPPHPWRGNDIYNATGGRQKVAIRLEDGEGVRFWLRLENDGGLDDTITLRGCRGTRQFVIKAVLIGYWKAPNWHAENITRQFKNGTATFPLPAATEHRRVALTLNIVAPTTAEGVSYNCPVIIRSQTDPTLADTVVARMTTY